MKELSPHLQPPESDHTYRHHTTPFTPHICHHQRPLCVCVVHVLFLLIKFSDVVEREREVDKE